MYNKIETKCNTIVKLYVDYLYMVRRDIGETWKISR